MNNAERLAKWSEVYTGELTAVLGRMLPSFARGDFHHGTYAINRTCAALGIKNTRGAIFAYLRGE